MALQFAHLHYVRLYRLERYAKEFYAGQTRIDPAQPVYRQILRERLVESANAVADWMMLGSDGEGQIRGFNRGVITMLGYFISHESHHRGNIVLTLKECGHPIPQKVRDALWGMWNQV